MFCGEYFDGILIEWWEVLLTLFIALAAIVAVIVVCGKLAERKKESFSFSTKDLTYGAVCVAAATALSYVRLFSLPYGGSITAASVLPMLVYCHYFGLRKGLIAATAFMLLQFIQGPYVVSPYSMLLDYVIPYLAVAATGIFRFAPEKLSKAENGKENRLSRHGGFFIGSAIYFAVRLSSHVLSGVLFWAQGIDFLIWSGDLLGFAALSYSFTYNILFLLPDTAIALLLAIPLFKSLSFDGFMTGSGNAL